MLIALAGQYRFADKHFAEDATAQKSALRLKTDGVMSYPTPHMSIAVVYLFSCSNNSGGRYHLVTTRLV